MSRKIMATITSRDRPGIVEEVTEVLVRHDGNLEESRMARLGGDFAGIMKIAVPEKRARKLVAALGLLKKKGISVSARPIEGSLPERLAGYLPHEIDVSGADHEGIVHSIAASLAELGANIEELSTSLVNAPITGTPLFNMRAVVGVPPSFGTGRLRERMDQIAAEQGVDVVVKVVLR